MTTPEKIFSSIRKEHAFFVKHCTQADADLESYFDWMRAFDPPEGPIRILDFGCGRGTLMARLLERLGWRGERPDLTLVEPTPAYRRQAVKRLSALTTRPILALDHLPAESVGGFDLILANRVFYYVPDLESTLSRLLRELNPNGMFLAGLAGPDNALADFWFRGFPLARRPAPLAGRTVPYWTAEDVEAALARLGRAYEEGKVRYVLNFRDTEKNRLKILRYLFKEHLIDLPTDPLLAFFDRYSSAGRIKVPMEDKQFRLARA